VVCNSTAAFKNFLPKLQDHLLGQLIGREFDGDMHEEFTDSDQNSIRFIGCKFYSVQTCHIYYTSYDLQQQCDTINSHSHPDIMLRSPINEEGADPYWYARSLSCQHLGREFGDSWCQKRQAHGFTLGTLVR
jgi:hypothetical protein